MFGFSHGYCMNCSTLLIRLTFIPKLKYKDLYKLFNNAFFGKTLENVRERQRIELVATKHQRKTRKLTASPAFKSFTILISDLK